MGTSKTIKRSRTKIVYFIFVLLVIVSCVLVGYGYFQALVSWWILMILFFPILIWSIKTSYIAPKIFCIVSIFTQVVTLPAFFIRNSDDWVWAGVNPFEFTVLETLPIIGKIALFLYTFVIFVYFFYRVSIKKIFMNNYISSNLKQIRALQSYATFSVRRKNPVLILCCIVLLISGLIALNLWSYSMGLGLTGVQPPKLPYKLSGIIFYFTKYLTPFLLGYLYSQTKRDWPLALIFLFYAWIFGLSSVSKGAVLIIMVPVIIFAWIDKRYIVLFFSVVGTLVGVTVAAGARAYVHIVQNGVAGSNTEINVFQLIINVLADPNTEIWGLDYIPLILVGITARIEGFGNLVLAQHYDPNAVIGAAGFALRMIWANLVNFPVDAHHLQWIGRVIPEGFFSGGAILSTIVIMGNSSLLWIVIGAMITALILVINEKIVNRFVYTYSKMVKFKGAIIFVLTLLFFTEATFSRISIAILIFLVIACWISPVLKNKNYKRAMYASEGQE